MSRLLALMAAIVRRAPLLTLVAVLVLTGLLGAASTRQVQDAGFENFAPDNEVSAALEEISERFGGAVDPVQLLVRTVDDTPILSPEGLSIAADLRAAIESDPDIAPHLIEAPGGAVHTYADIVLQGAAEAGTTPETVDEVRALHAAGLAAMPESQAVQVTRLLAGEGDGTDAEVGAVLVLLDGDLETSAGFDAARAIDRVEVDAPGIEVRTLDFRVLADEVNADIEADLQRLLALAFGLIVLFLIVIYRRPLDVIASVLGLIFTIVWMQGLATLLGPSFLGLTGGMNEMTTAIPILLVGLGVDYGIHLTMRYREERGHGAVPAGAATGAIAAVGTALALATITTMVGFLTNVANPLPPLRDFSVFAAVGVLSAFLIMTTFVPAARLVTDRWRDRRGRLRDPVSNGDHHPSLLGRASAVLAPVATHRPWTILTAAALLTVVGGVSATNLSTEFSQTEFFPDGSEPLETIELADDAFGGDLTETTQVLIEGDVTQPGVPAALAAFEERAGDIPGVRTRNGRAEADSVLSRVGSILAAVAAGEPVAADPDALAALQAAAAEAGIGTPDGPAPDASLPPLVEALEAVDPSAAGLADLPDALLVELATTVGDDVAELRQELAQAAEPLEGEGLTVTAASEGLLIDVVLDELRNTQLSGLLLTLAAAAVILSLAFWVRVREPVLGLLAIGAVGLVVAWVFGVMAALGIPFNVMTAMVSALAIGIGVPYGIHVVNRFLEDRDRFEDLGDAVRSTLEHTGGALVGSAVTTMIGFGALVLSAIPPFRQFGAVLALTIGFALLASVAVLPALLVVHDRVRGRSRRPPDGERQGADRQPEEARPLGSSSAPT